MRPFGLCKPEGSFQLTLPSFPHIITHVKSQFVPWNIRDLAFAILAAGIAILMLNVAFFLLDRTFQNLLRGNPEALSAFLIAQEVVILGAAWLFTVARYRVGWERLGLRGFAVTGGC